MGQQYVSTDGHAAVRTSGRTKTRGLCREAEQNPCMPLQGGTPWLASRGSDWAGRKAGDALRLPLRGPSCT